MTWDQGGHLMHRELEPLPLEELIARFRGPPPGGPRNGPVYYDDVALAIRRQGEAGVDFLLRELRDADTDHARAVIFALGLPPELPQVRDVVLAHLRSRRPLVVMEAVDAARHLGIRTARDNVLALRRHRSPYVRGAVLRYMGELFPDEAVALAMEALHDPHYVVRESAVDVLDELQAVEALPAIRPLLADPHPYVREAAQTAVKNLEELA